MEIVGLLLTLCGLGGIFFVWLQLMGNKAKPANLISDESGSEFDGSYTPSLRLIPAVEPQDSCSTNPIASSMPAEEQVKEELPSDVDTLEPAHDEAEDKHLRTQLDIAVQLFETGDFEGAYEMAEIVSESRTASEVQTERAREIMSLCSTN